ncbi:MAG: prephenate dehydrogenase dimerization domain-containing protein [Mediterraneibacter gnavus]
MMQVTGTISHLPHIIASCLVNFVKSTDTKEELMKLLAAGGFKDITRIASSSPIMWQQICLKNKDNISRILGAYIEELNRAKISIDAGNERGIIFVLLNLSRRLPGIPCRIISRDRSKRFFALY